MTRLPTPGADDGLWGQLLNDYLSVAHDTSGAIKPNAVNSAALQPNSVTNTQLDSGTGSDGQVLTKDAVSSGGFKWTTMSGGASPATGSTLGTVQLAGDLGGTATAPTVPGLAGKQATITAGTTAQYYRGDKTFQTLDKTAVGLANVDNTSDANKPVSSATTTALGLKADKTTTITAGTGLTGGGDLSANRTLTVAYGATAGTAAQGNDTRITGAEQAVNKGAASGYAPLGSDSKVPVANLPKVFPPVTLTDAATVATDASLGNHFRVTLTANRILGVPSNPVDGQKVTWEVIQDGVGSHTLTLDAIFALGTDISTITLSTAAGARDFLGAVYNATATKWYVIAFVKGY
ncbi:MAG TPA: hypothetical protein VK502_01760 [Candidatus Saccharimonadales bacterium]|nr:hypothetical protein [Candidatus Saccharimonadales bacterium]